MSRLLELHHFATEDRDRFSADRGSRGERSGDAMLAQLSRIAGAAQQALLPLGTTIGAIASTTARRYSLRVQAIATRPQAGGAPEPAGPLSLSRGCHSPDGRALASAFIEKRFR